MSLSRGYSSSKVGIDSIIYLFMLLLNITVEARCWEIRELRSRYSPTSSRDTQSIGQVGMFATRRILKGEPIFGETPMIALELHQDQLKGATRIPSVMAAVQNLDQTERDAYLSLTKRDPRISGLLFDHHHTGLEINELKEIFISNAICLPSCCQKEGYCEWGVFEHLSRVNHSCMPNAVGMTYNRKLRGTGQCQHWLHARRDIEQGEEITISYVEALCTEVNVTVRASVLKERFICWCLRCVYDRRGSSWLDNVPLNLIIDYKNENPVEYPKIWMDRIKVLSTAVPHQPTQETRLKKGRRDSMSPPLVFNDTLIELNEIPKKKQILIFAKRTGRRMAKRISSLPVMLENAKQNISNAGKGKKLHNQKDQILQRRIKFPESSILEGSEHVTMRQALEHGSVREGKGKQRAGSNLLPTEWATMSAIMIRQDSEMEIACGSGGTTHSSRNLRATWDPNLPLRYVGTEPHVTQGDNQSLVHNEQISPTPDSDFGVADPASTGTELWESPGGRSRSRVDIPPEQLKSLTFGRITESTLTDSFSPRRERSTSNQGRRTIPFVPEGDQNLSDQYYMSRLGVEEVTAERLGRANSLSLKSPVDGELTPEETAGPQPPAFIQGQGKQKGTSISHSDGKLDTNTNNERPGFCRYPSLTDNGSSIHNQGSNTRDVKMTGNLHVSASSSTDTVVKRPTSVVGEGSISSGELSPLSREASSSVTSAQERYRNTFYTLDRGFVSPGDLRMGITKGNLESSPAEPEICPNHTGRVLLRDIPPNQSTYRTSDGNFSTRRAEQVRRPSSSSEPESLGRCARPRPSASRFSSASFPGANNAMQHHQEHRRGSSSGSLHTYTYGIAERHTTQRIQPRGRTWSTGNVYGAINRQATPRPHYDGRQSSTRSLSEGVGSGRIQEYNRFPPSSQDFRSGETSNNGRRSEYQRQQYRSESFFGPERERSTIDSRYRRPQSRAESFGAGSTSSCAQYQTTEAQVHEAIPQSNENLAQKVRELFERARDNLPQSRFAPEGPTEVGACTREGNLDIERTTKHPSMQGAISSREAPQIAGTPAPAEAPGRETMRSLHLMDAESPSSSFTQGLDSEENSNEALDNNARPQPDSDDQPQGNLMSLGQARGGFSGQLGSGLPLLRPEVERVSGDTEVQSHSQTINFDQNARVLSNSPRQPLVENDNPRTPVSSIVKSVMVKPDNKNVKDVAVDELRN